MPSTFRREDLLLMFDAYKILWNYLFLAEIGHLFGISANANMDRNKANIEVKGLICT